MITYIYMYVHTHIHTYIHTCWHTYMQISQVSFSCPCKYPSPALGLHTHTCMHAYIHTYIQISQVRQPCPCKYPSHAYTHNLAYIHTYADTYIHHTNFTCKALMPTMHTRLYYTSFKQWTIIDDISPVSYPKPEKGESQHGWSRNALLIPSTCI